MRLKKALKPLAKRLRVAPLLYNHTGSLDFTGSVSSSVRCPLVRRTRWAVPTLSGGRERMDFSFIPGHVDPKSLEANSENTAAFNSAASGPRLSPWRPRGRPRQMTTTVVALSVFISALTVAALLLSCYHGALPIPQSGNAGRALGTQWPQEEDDDLPRIIDACLELEEKVCYGGVAAHEAVARQEALHDIEAFIREEAQRFEAAIRPGRPSRSPLGLTPAQPLPYSMYQQPGLTLTGFSSSEGLSGMQQAGFTGGWHEERAAGSFEPEVSSVYQTSTQEEQQQISSDPPGLHLPEPPRSPGFISFAPSAADLGLSPSDWGPQRATELPALTTPPSTQALGTESGGQQHPSTNIGRKRRRSGLAEKAPEGDVIKASKKSKKQHMEAATSLEEQLQMSYPQSAIQPPSAQLDPLSYPQTTPSLHHSQMWHTVDGSRTILVSQPLVPEYSHRPQWSSSYAPSADAPESDLSAGFLEVTLSELQKAISSPSDGSTSQHDTSALARTIGEEAQRSQQAKGFDEAVDLSAEQQKAAMLAGAFKGTSKAPVSTTARGEPIAQPRISLAPSAGGQQGESSGIHASHLLMQPADLPSAPSAAPAEAVLPAGYQQPSTIWKGSGDTLSRSATDFATHAAGSVAVTLTLNSGAVINICHPPPPMPTNMHVYYRLPVVKPDAVRTCFDSDAAYKWAGGMIGNRFLRVMHDLLRKPELNNIDVEDLVRASEQLVQYLLTRQTRNLPEMSPRRRAELLGTRYLCFDVLISLTQVLGPAMRPQEWLPRLARAIPSNLPSSALHVRKPNERFSELCKKLSEALALLKQGQRPSPEMTIYLKRNLFSLSGGPFCFKDKKWDPWRDDDAPDTTS
ncbi:hypothetical protein Efla_000776 [Eimeria flavescens]